jgi:hypothetical protein
MLSTYDPSLRTASVSSSSLLCRPHGFYNVCADPDAVQIISIVIAQRPTHGRETESNHPDFANKRIHSCSHSRNFAVGTSFVPLPCDLSAQQSTEFIGSFASFATLPATAKHMPNSISRK